jgi:hypothetical protein
MFGRGVYHSEWLWFVARYQPNCKVREYINLPDVVDTARDYVFRAINRIDVSQFSLATAESRMAAVRGLGGF